MDWMTLLSPIIGIVLTTMTAWALNWVRKYLQVKYQIAVSDDQFEAAKKAVLNVEEMALSGKLIGESGAGKRVVALDHLKEARPGIDPDTALRKIDEAVAVLPGIGATGKVKNPDSSINPNPA